MAALMACTLGMDAERRLRTTGAQQPLEGAVLDAACSAYVEAAVEQMDQQAKAAAAAHGLAGNWRFSPGYGDCPLGPALDRGCTQRHAPHWTYRHAHQPAHAHQERDRGDRSV